MKGGPDIPQKILLDDSILMDSCSSKRTTDLTVKQEIKLTPLFQVARSSSCVKNSFTKYATNIFGKKITDLTKITNIKDYAMQFIKIKRLQ